MRRRRSDGSDPTACARVRRSRQLIALDAVLADLVDQAPVDEVWALGDLVAIGPDPVGVLERLHSLPNCRFLAGNTERTHARENVPCRIRRRPRVAHICPAMIAASRGPPAGCTNQAGSTGSRRCPRRYVANSPPETSRRRPRDPGSRRWARTPPVSFRTRNSSSCSTSPTPTSCARDTPISPSSDGSDNASAVNLGSISNPSRHGDGAASYVVIDATGPEADISHRSVDYDMQAVLQQLLDLRHPRARLHRGRLLQPAPQRRQLNASRFRRPLRGKLSAGQGEGCTGDLDAPRVPPLARRRRRRVVAPAR